MRRNRYLIAIILGSFSLILFYSTLTLNERVRRGGQGGSPNPTPNSTHWLSARNETKAAWKNSPSPGPLDPDGKTKTPPSTARPRVQQVSISEQFRQAIPQSSAWWNRKQHESFQLLAAQQLDNSTQSQPACRLTSDALRAQIQDFDSYPALYRDFLQAAGCRDYALLMEQPGKCRSRFGGEGEEEVFLLLAIKSMPENFVRRQAVRESWGMEMAYDGLQVRTVFLLGTTSGEDDPDLTHLVSHEAQRHGDLLQWGFRDSFFNLTLKDNLFLHWVDRRCPRTRFIFKGDDDVFLNTPELLRYLRSLQPDQAGRLYVGQVVTQASPFRSAKSKYYVPETFYEGAYPPYTGGGGFLFSGSLVRPLLRLSLYIPFFPIDDVYTGMCFQALGVAPVLHNGFQTFDIREQDRENACVHKSLLLVHQRSPQQMLRLRRALQDPGLRC
ncbi:B3GN2 acetylglucosaminyltransferase, partial [Atractosteus spatula]|nr:B3GN2 acetylglucosaminyltransferase [Atractosteus spatula]